MLTRMQLDSSEMSLHAAPFGHSGQDIDSGGGTMKQTGGGMRCPLGFHFFHIFHFWVFIFFIFSYFSFLGFHFFHIFHFWVSFRGAFWDLFLGCWARVDNVGAWTCAHGQASWRSQAQPYLASTLQASKELK